MTLWSADSSTGRRLALTFGLLIALFAAAMGFALHRLNAIEEGLTELRRREEGVVLALQLASAVRDQYAHQAHSIIIGDLSHLGFYGASHAHVLELVGALRARTQDRTEREVIDSIEGASWELDLLFRRSLLPAMMRGEGAEVRRVHEEQLKVVDAMQGHVDRLAERFERSIEAMEARSRLLATTNFRISAGIFAAMLLLAAVLGFAIWRSIKAHRDQLVRSEKLAGIGRLAAGVAHEINNPLAVILGYARLLQRREGQVAPEALGDLKAIEEEALRAREIVEGLLDLARPRAIGHAPIDLRELCDELLEKLRETDQLRGERVTITGDGVCEGAPTKLRQVVLNLVRNALQALDGRGTITIALESRGGEIELAVTDDGPGLSEEVQRRLFEPFHSTKSGGTGLGLAVSRAIAQAHGGDLEFAPSPGGGARFVLRLPRTQPRPQEKDA